MMNWAALMGRALPAALPAERTIKLIFMFDLNPRGFFSECWPSSRTPLFDRSSLAYFWGVNLRFRRELGEMISA